MLSRTRSVCGGTAYHPVPAGAAEIPIRSPPVHISNTAGWLVPITTQPPGWYLIPAPARRLVTCHRDSPLAGTISLTQPVVWYPVPIVVSLFICVACVYVYVHMYAINGICKWPKNNTFM